MPRQGAAATKRAGVPRKLWLLLVGLASLVLVAPVFLRVFVLQAFRIPSGAMFPSLLVGDHVFINKWGAGCESCVPERGSASVFLYPESTPDEPYDYVKRVIALPGEELVVEHGAPVINGWKVPRCSLGHARMADLEGAEHGYEFFVEFLSGNAYLVVHEDDRDDGVQGPYLVGPKEAWVLGDNRMNSSDSRAWRVGKGAGVPFENFHGPIRMLWLPPDRFGSFGSGPPRLPPGAAALAPQLERCLASAPSVSDSTPPRR
jgi:signal peptidase I